MNQDSDNQFKSALVFYSLKKDPYEAFQSYLSSKDTKKILYISRLIAVLGDRRFYHQLKQFEGDQRAGYEFTGETIGKHISTCLLMLREGSEIKDGKKFEPFAEKWLTNSWKIKLDR